MFLALWCASAKESCFARPVSQVRFESVLDPTNMKLSPRRYGTVMLAVIIFVPRPSVLLDAFFLFQTLFHSYTDDLFIFAYINIDKLIALITADLI